MIGCWLSVVGCWLLVVGWQANLHFPMYHAATRLMRCEDKDFCYLHMLRS